MNVCLLSLKLIYVFGSVEYIVHNLVSLSKLYSNMNSLPLNDDESVIQ